MHEIFDDAGGEATRVLTEMDSAEDFYMQEVAQVKVESWSKGRVVPVGDAAFCPSPISDGYHPRYRRCISSSRRGQ
jgi:2-polyprenyl-6-methoxyphenol hydroxylase-like FAD-dependent oxidoreductase